MTETTPYRLRTVLTYAGTLPFIACTLCLVMNIRTVPILGSVDHILTVYGIIIATFLAGSHWGQHLSLLGPGGWFFPGKQRHCSCVVACVPDPAPSFYFWDTCCQLWGLPLP